jgi:LPXTG-site transpeptidase (sortase) family protein
LNPKAKTWIRRLLNLGIWIGVLCVLSPLLTWTAGRLGQWRLERHWAAAEVAAARSQPRRTHRAQPHRVHHHPAPLGPNSLVRLTIPRMHLNAFVVYGVSSESLAQGPGFFPGSPPPGEVGNCAIAGHRNVWGSWFADLNFLKKEDLVVLDTPEEHCVYRVTGIEIVGPNDLGVLDSDDTTRELTLITCTHPATRRIVAHARLDMKASQL